MNFMMKHVDMVIICLSKTSIYSRLWLLLLLLLLLLLDVYLNLKVRLFCLLVEIGSISWVLVIAFNISVT
jgi:hypothetical protein